uniref:Alpha/beta hydrolase fold-3 domain-containing protein n=1 Tax=Aegilops tauschii TaxID=37682 RepID=N1R1C1_AEGTA
MAVSGCSKSSWWGFSLGLRLKSEWWYAFSLGDLALLINHKCRRQHGAQHGDRAPEGGHRGLRDKVSGVALLHSYFWGTEPVGGESPDAAFFYPGDTERVWDVACGDKFGRDHPYINPAASPEEWRQLGSGRMLVTTAELCWFVERARAYAKGMKACGWAGELEFYETRGKKHTYFLFRPDCDDAAKELAVVADFVRRC